MKIEIQIKKNMIHFREDRFQIFTISLLALEPKYSLLPHLQWIWSKWCQLNIITGRGNPFPYIWNLALQTKIPVILSISSSKITIIKFIFAFGFSSSSSSGPPPFSHLFCGFGPVQCTLSTCEQCLTKSLGNLQFSWETSETKHLPQNLFQKTRWKSALSTFSLKEVSWRIAFSILFLNHFVKSKF